MWLEVAAIDKIVRSNRAADSRQSLPSALPELVQIDHASSVFGMAVSVCVCDASELDVIASLEPTGQNFAIRMFAAQEQGLCRFLIAWAGEGPMRSAELTTKKLSALKTSTFERHIADRASDLNLSLPPKRQSENQEVLQSVSAATTPGLPSFTSNLVMCEQDSFPQRPTTTSLTKAPRRQPRRPTRCLSRDGDVAPSRAAQLPAKCRPGEGSACGWREQLEIGVGRSGC